MAEPYEYHSKKRTDRTYVSRAFPDGFGDSPNLRMVSKVVDAPETHEFALVDGKHIIVVKQGRRQEMVAVFYEDSRQIKHVTLQTFDVSSGVPIKQSFTFRQEDVDQLEKALHAIHYIDLEDGEKQRLDDELLDARFASRSEIRRFIAEHPDIVQEIVRHDIKTNEVVALGYRKEQLSVFECLLNDADFFDRMKAEWNQRRNEDVWQYFFEKNTWIFGHGLDYIFRTSLDDKRLEQITSGHSVAGRGKRIDGLMKSKGALSILCFVEIKLHTTPLIERNKRPECWSVSNDVVDAIAQIQKTVHKAVTDIRERLTITDDDGNPTGEVAYLCQPKSYLVIGSMEQFANDFGVNMEQFTSFELFRRQCVQPEIITFDELLERARFIVHHEETDEAADEHAGGDQPYDDEYIGAPPPSDDIPF